MVTTLTDRLANAPTPRMNKLKFEILSDLQSGTAFVVLAEHYAAMERENRLLREHVRHKWSCDLVGASSRRVVECTCGLDQLLAELDKPQG